MTGLQLHGGQLGSWADVLAVFGGWEFAWQDLDGIHIAALPESPPPSSLFHGWLDEALARLRWDGSRAYVAHLSHRRPDDKPHARMSHEADATVISYEPQPWAGSTEVSPRQQGVTEIRWRHTEVLDTGSGGLLFMAPVPNGGTR